MICTFSTFLAVLGFGALSQIKDSLNMGKEMRTLLVPAFMIEILMVMNTFPAGFDALFVQSKGWAIICDCFLMPTVVMIQTLYPLVLSWRNEKRKRLQKRRNKKTLPMKQSGSRHMLRESMSNSFLNTSTDGIRLEEILKNRQGREYFYKFISKEFSLENLLFFEDCLKYEELCEMKENPEKIAQFAHQIYDKFILESSPYCVNICSERRHMLVGQFRSVKLRKEKKKSVHYDSKLFEAAQAEVFQLMVSDTFSRFKETQDYKQCRTLIANSEETLLS
eukprot:TRINITY_DN15727_c0_g1_i1.p1 TRINITY_DN15727_c0_g1~~TRINITY_DN15727_c0_g1_i1.p1  ORF type:complete len:278 (+),score=79.43 TRINITY_DN15727_c0_g1_i1:3-836(+)